jgi:hypothetical protein
MITIIVSSFGGGLLRGLVGLVKHQLSYKEAKFRLFYSLALLFVSGAIGSVATLAIKEVGFNLLGSFTPALAFIIGYAGGDFIENIYKIIIKKSSIWNQLEKS